MTIVVTPIRHPYSIGDRYQSINSVKLDASYPTGGYPLKPIDLGFVSRADPEFHVDVQPTAGYIPEYDHVNAKLLMYDQKDPAAAGGADIPLPQVGNTVDLHLVTVRVVATGKF